MFPAEDISVNMFCSNVISKNGYAFTVLGLLNAPPIPSNRPTAGKMAIGNMNDFPKFSQIIYSFLLPPLK